MNYKKIYQSIIKKRKKFPISKTEYSERHHIIPKSLKGSDKSNNLIRLSAREHFICHHLLSKMYKEESFEWYKMNNAFMIMKCNNCNQCRYFNNRLYELRKKSFSKVMSKLNSGKNNASYSKVWIYNVDLEQSKKIAKDQVKNYLLQGWKLGRIINWTNWKKKQKLKKEKQRLRKIRKERIRVKKLKKLKRKQQRKLKRQKQKQEKQRLDELEIKNHTMASGIYVNKCRRNKIKEIFNINLDNDFSNKIIELKNILDNLYNEKKKSLPEIAKLYNSNSQTISNYLDLFNISRRNFSEAVKNYFKN